MIKDLLLCELSAILDSVFSQLAKFFSVLDLTYRSSQGLGIAGVRKYATPFTN